FLYRVYQLATRSLSSRALVTIVFYIFHIVTPLTTMAQFFTQAQRTMGETERNNSLIEEEYEEDTISDKDNVNIENENGITFFNVGFSYNKNREILNNINFTAKKGQKTAIVGESGAGKTTLFSLLERFYHVDRGNIYY